MSKAMFVESLSDDPVTREIARKAVRLMNDTTLERWQRERHIVKLQKRLEARQAQLASRHPPKAKAMRAAKAADPSGGVSVDTRAVVARRRECKGSALPAQNPQTLADVRLRSEAANDASKRPKLTLPMRDLRRQA
jgi:hypothetical protein